jgi:hypothetical protein
VFLEVRALQVLLEVLVVLLQTWFTATQIHQFQTHPQETMFIMDTRLTIQIDTDIKFVALTTMPLHTITLELIMEHHTPQVMEKLDQFICLKTITEAVIPPRPTIQIHIAIMAVITTRPIMMDPTVGFITGMDIGGMPIIN